MSGMSKVKSLFKKFTDPKERSLKIKGLRAAGWTAIGRGLGRVLRLCSSLILTRILFPEAFGLMASATIILQMIQLVSDTGIRTALIQNPRGNEPEYLNSALIISLVRGVVLFILTLGLSKPLALFYGHEELTGMLGVMAFGIIVNSFENPALALVIRKLRAEKQVAYELGTQVLGLITNVIFALVLQNVWALVFGTLCTQFYRMIGSYIVEPYKPKLIWNKAAGKELIGFGKHIMINTLVTWVTMNADKLFIGKLIDMDTLGIYSIGLNMGIMVEVMFILVFNQSYFPAVSSVANDLQRVIKIYRRSVSLVMAISVPILMLSAIFSKEIIELFYDERYILAYIAAFWISLRGLFRVISVAQSGTFLSLGKPVYESWSMFCGMITVFILLPAGAYTIGQGWGLEFEEIFQSIFALKKEYGIEPIQGAAMAIFTVGVVIAFVESLFMTFKLKFPVSIVVRPWMQVLLVGGSIGTVYYFLAPMLSSTNYYNLPFIILMAIISFAASGITYILLEGKNPFSDQGGATKTKAI
ncbi:MAG: hypothetical protein DWQ06_01010 [Calditrichaeota bacterium]|nr:MAG: hypothetical protein DWQ06_01010 [Calditrichota bacterium]